MQAALHQQLALGLANQLDSLRRGRIAVRHVDDLEAADVQVVLARHGRDLCRRSDKDRNDDARFGRLDGAAQRGLVTGVHDNRRRWRHLFCQRDQAVIFAGRACPASIAVTSLLFVVAMIDSSSGLSGRLCLGFFWNLAEVTLHWTAVEAEQPRNFPHAPAVFGETARPARRSTSVIRS